MTPMRRDYAGGLPRSGPMGNAVASVVLMVFVGLLGALWPERAEACACCDGRTSRSAVGWSTTGKTLLVRNEDWTRCENSASLELWRVGRERPARCYDLFADPDRRIACGDVAPASSEEFEPTPKSSRVESKFTPATPIDPRWVRSWRRADPVDDLAEDFGLETHTVVVEVWTGDAWHEVWRGHAGESRYPGAADEPELSAPLAVELWPTPAGDRAALLLRHDYDDPGIGHFYDRVIWVTLPEATGALPDLRAVGPSWQAESIPAFVPPVGWHGERRRSARENSRGLRLHRKGKFGAAAPHFIEALRFDAGNVMARYNLACALARVGLVERSLSVLEELARAAAEGSCPKCGPRIERAATDEDFAGVRGDPRFRAIVITAPGD